MPRFDSCAQSSRVYSSHSLDGILKENTANAVAEAPLDFESCNFRACCVIHPNEGGGFKSDFECEKDS